jgi:hypothetical protein
MVDLAGQPAEIRFTLQITRAATGKVETVEMVGYVNPPKEQTNGSDSLDGSAQRGDGRSNSPDRD